MREDSRALWPDAAQSLARNKTIYSRYRRCRHTSAACHTSWSCCRAHRYCNLVSTSSFSDVLGNLDEHDWAHRRRRAFNVLRIACHRAGVEETRGRRGRASSCRRRVSWLYDAVVRVHGSNSRRSLLFLLDDHLFFVGFQCTRAKDKMAPSMTKKTSRKTSSKTGSSKAVVVDAEKLNGSQKAMKPLLSVSWINLVMSLL